MPLGFPKKFKYGLSAGNLFRIFSSDIVYNTGTIRAIPKISNIVPINIKKNSITNCFLSLKFRDE